MDMIVKNVFSSVVILSLFGAGCTRPLNCVADKCDAESSSKAAGPAPSPGDQPEVKPPPPSLDAGAAADAMAKQLNGLKGQMKLQGMVATLEAKLADMDQRYLEGLRDQLEAVSGLKATLAGEQAATGKLLETLSVKKAIEGGKLLELLNGFAADREAQRLGLMKQLEELEIAILDPLTPEGLVAQVQWDGFFGKLDVVRELSVKSEILKTRDDMLAAVEATYVADKAILTALVEAIIDTNLALVDANAPASAARVLSRLIALETELRIATGPDAAEQRESLAKQIDKTQELIKMPLDAVDPKIFQQLVGLVTEIKTAEGMIAGMGAGVEALDAFGAKQLSAIASLKKTFTELRGAAATLRTKPVESEANGAVFGDSVGATMAVLDEVASSFEAIKSGLAKLPEIDLKAGFPAETVAQLEAGEARLGAVLAVVRQSLDNLGKIAESKAACTQGEGSAQEGVPVRDMLCGETITVIASP
jgi:hypothetical protein